MISGVDMGGKNDSMDKFQGSHLSKGKLVGCEGLELIVLLDGGSHRPGRRKGPCEVT